MANTNRKLYKDTFSTTPCVLNMEKKGARPAPFSFSNIMKSVTALEKPLRELRTGERFVPRKERLLKERVLRKSIKQIPFTDIGSKNLVLYHGTKAENLPQIMREGLKPSDRSGEYAIFFTPHKWRARYYAKKGSTFKRAITGKGKENVILAVDVPEHQLQHYNIQHIKNMEKRGFPYKDIKVYQPIPPQRIVGVDVSKDNQITTNKKIFISKVSYEDAIAKAQQAGYRVKSMTKNRRGEYVVFSQI